MTYKWSIESYRIGKKILLLSAMLMITLTATIPISNISLIQMVAAQNTTSTNVIPTSKPELAIVPGNFIANLKDTSEFGGLAASDPVSTLIQDLEQQGLNASVSSVIERPNAATVLLQIEPSESADSPFAGAAAADVTKEIEQILKQNPLVESAQADMAMKIPKPLVKPNNTVSSTQITPTGVDRVDSEKPLSDIDIVNADIAIIDTGVNPHPDIHLYKRV